jgi:hypothetical protein
MKRFIVAFIAAYIFMFFWGWLLNGVLLKDIYAETPNLWRSQSEMMSLFHWIIIGQALIILAFVMIYAGGFAGGGVVAGIRLGILLEIAAIGMRLGFYAVAAFSRKVNRLREYRRPDRNDHRRDNCRCDLQTDCRADGLALFGWGAQAASLFVSAACRDAGRNSASLPRKCCRRAAGQLQAGSPRSPEFR